LEDSYSARVILTVSVVAVEAGLIVSVPLRVTPFRVPLIIALVVEVTALVVMVKVADAAPEAMVTLAGTAACVLLLARLTTVAAEALALNRTVPCTVFPPVTEVGFNVKDDNVGAVAASGVTVTVT